MSFIEKIIDGVQQKDTRLVLGIDPIWEYMPDVIKINSIEKHGVTVNAGASAIKDFVEFILPEVKQHVVAVKIQLAYFEVFGGPGYEQYVELTKFCQSHGLPVISDVKRGDIESSSRAYAKAHIGQIEIMNGQKISPVGADAMTVHPYMGMGGILPFFEEAVECDKGIFVVLKTPNQYSGEIQDYPSPKFPLYKHLAKMLNDISEGYINRKIGFSPLGVVVGCADNILSRELREILPHSIFLMPGFGFQGGISKNLEGVFCSNGSGAIVNSSRGILYRYQGKNWLKGIVRSVVESKNEINRIANISL